MSEEYISNVSEQVTPPTDIPPSAKPMSKIIIIIGGLILLIIGLSVGFVLSKSSSEIPKSQPIDKACTQEAKICPDGSSVSRTGPNCEFAPCLQQVKVSPTSTNDPIFSWLALAETKNLKFSIKYPPTWHIIDPYDSKDKDNSGIGSNCIASPDLKGMNEGIGGGYNIQRGMYICVDYLGNRASNKEYCNEKGDIKGNGIDTCFSININNIPAIKRVSDYQYPIGDFSKGYQNHFIYIDQFNVAIHTLFQPTEDNNKLIDQILSTFKFLE